MTFFTKPQWQQLVENGLPENEDKDHVPVVRLYTRYGNCVWLLTQSDPRYRDNVCGLCDRGMGFPEPGCFNVRMLHEEFAQMGMPVLLDQHFTGKYPISVYDRAAQHCRYITTDESILQEFVQKKNSDQSQS